ncbi:helix-hairpin-helix domain-containing protein [Propioniciclava sp. MC1683]|uniref:helix-hairpin-helix domain-containing protein n=1 Tax=Propioniciclava sp. MC1683 TaxID=2760309 RepID=UPI0016003F3C|nr:helix-hairpin-helix domain-containing protein [Propioniciclava sp. MC1683]MBB1500539.1 helix-hairpin-helix domain-containing protein [Propioniciclava sp. MC1683]
MRPSRARPVQGDVVRARLDALVAELGAAREAVPGDVLAPDPPPVVDVGAEEAGVDPAPRRELPRAGVAAALRSAWVFGRAHAAVIGVIGLVALVGAVWAISQARTVPIAVAAPTPVAPVLATPSPTPTPVPLRVHVLGEVASPGVVRLPQGSRVEDAIAAAGGLTPEARPGELNLAAPVVDGGQVVIGDGRNPGGEMRAGAAPGAGGGAGGGGSGKLDLNTATADQLDGLPGVGPVTASAILAWREQHERFSRVEELLEIEGIGTKTFQRLEPLVTV